MSKPGRLLRRSWIVAAGMAAGSLPVWAQQAVPRAPVEPLGVIGVPDVNAIGLLDRSGPGGAAWKQITNPGQKTTLQQLGKALFWDMQVGGDGIQACASCHFHAGADHRVTHQLNPGRKAGDLSFDLAALNARLGTAHYNFAANGVGPNRGFPVSEANLLAAGATPDALDGKPGAYAKVGTSPVLTDTHDVVSSQGIRSGTQLAITGAAVDTATPTLSSEGFGALRQVPPRNSPSVLNAVYNVRNFWDGRADSFFNGVNPLGARDPDARVLTWVGGALLPERLDLPLSALASQAIGPLLSTVEMVFDGRKHADLGKKLTTAGVMPLAGQTVALTDQLLGGALRQAGGKGLNRSYSAFVRQSFDARFWGEPGMDICLGANDSLLGKVAEGGCASLAGFQYTLLQRNFALFFGLAVQAYEATLRTDRTIVDLLAGGVATGTVTANRITVNVTGLALEGCVALLAGNNGNNAVAAATTACANHYAKFIDPAAVSGSESALAPFPVANQTAIGGCATPPNCTLPAARQTAARNTLLNVQRGLNRFAAGATGCAICHVNTEFTGATVSAITGFGAVLPALPAGQLRREVERRVVMERMLTFNGAAAVYDAGFYNIGVRPTVEDLSLGDQIGGVPLSLAKILQITAGGTAALGSADAVAAGIDVAKTQQVGQTLLARSLMIPRAPTDLSPVPFPYDVACGPGLVGQGGKANNNPDAQCIPALQPAERILRNGAFKTPGLRNAKFTGPYLHNGSKMNLRQVVEFYKTAGHFTQISLNNLDGGMRVFNLGVADEAALVELMETGLTDWRVATKQAPFDHPELCLPHGHAADGRSVIRAVPAVGAAGTGGALLATFEDMLIGGARLNGKANTLSEACTVPGVADASGLSLIDLR